MPVDINDTKAALNAAADLLSQEGKWGQGEYARDAKGKALRIHDGQWMGYSHDPSEKNKLVPSEPVCFCAVGAIMEVTRFSSTGVERSEAVSALAKALNTTPYNVPEWNDNPDTERDEVVSIFRKAADTV